MEFVVKHKYLVLPVNTNITSKKVCLKSGEKLLFDFDCKIDALSPKSTAYIDISRFKGMTVDISITPYMDVEIGFSDFKELKGLWQESLRPKIHFTVANGYNNDPNGLIYYNGLYHMFYQHNPCSNQWGNMHWGHAISKDLMHWEEQDSALFPDEMGTMFSGCAIEDERNVSGLGNGDKSPMLLYYTAAGNESILSKGKKFTQCIAYSNDDGKTFEKYEGNPVVEYVMDLNRDPKVVWVEELNKYVMILYLSDDLYQMLTSSNLIDWIPLKEIHIRGERECPDIYPIKCANDKKWVISGASDHYLVGRFTSSSFVIESSERKLTYSNAVYAAQSFSGVKDGRIIRICWNKNKTHFLDYRFSQQMGIPMKMSLEKIDNRYYLSALPVEEISNLYLDEYKIENTVLNKAIRWNVGNNPVEILLKMPYVNDVCITLSVFGARIRLETAQNNIFFGQIKMPISLIGDSIDLHIIVDTCSVEVFADGGKFCFTQWNICDFNFPYVEISCTTHVKIDKIECHTLKSIHE